MHISKYVLRIDERSLAMMPVGDAQTIRVMAKDWEVAYERWSRACKQWDGLCNSDERTHAASLNMPIANSFKEADYDGRLSKVDVRLH